MCFLFAFFKSYVIIRDNLGVICVKWMDVNYTDGYEKLFKIQDGDRSMFSRMTIDDEEYLLKVFTNCTEEKRKVVERFRDLSCEGVHAFPMGKVYVYGRDEGYVCKYYSDALNFADCWCSILPYDLKYQATFDNSKQLRFLHQNGFIANDIRLTNNIISFKEQHGMMIDFEDMILEDEYRDKSSYYRFFDKDWNALPSSKWGDVKKQFICNVSLLLETNIEEFAICSNQEKFLSLFRFDSEIHSFASSLFEDGEILYFDTIAPSFSDSEKVKYYAKSLPEDVRSMQ